MKNLTKMVLGSISLMGLAASAPAALAQDATAAAAPAFALTGTVDVQSDYRFRGISQSRKNPVPQGSLNLTGPDGWYVGAWASQINWQLGCTSQPCAAGTNENPSVELDIYGGKHFDLKGTDLNVEAYEYAYPDAKVFNGPAASYFEGIFTLSHTFGPLALDAVYAVSPQFSLGGGVGNYMEGQAVLTILDWLTISTNVGHQWVGGAPTDYTHSDAGATATWKGISLDARYVTTTLNKTNCTYYMGTKNACTGGFVATLSYTMPLLPWTD